jgi:hypothetical protein
MAKNFDFSPIQDDPAKCLYHWIGIISGTLANFSMRFFKVRQAKCATNEIFSQRIKVPNIYPRSGGRRGFGYATDTYSSIAMKNHHLKKLYL